MMLIAPATVSGGGGGGTTSGCNSGAETSSDGAGVYRPVRWTDTDDDSRYVGSERVATTPRGWADVKGRKLLAERAERRLYESNHSISIPL